MIPFYALPSELYEIINCAIAAMAWITLAICIRYLVISYQAFRVERFNSIWTSLWMMTELKLAIGFTVFLTGEAPRMTWVWFARFAINTRQSPDWMGQMPWVLLPILSSLITVIGLACMVRALVPRVWGRFGYFGSLLLAAAAVIGTFYFR